MIQFRILGPQNGLVIDEVQQSLIKLQGRKYKSHLERFIPLYKYSKQYKKNMYYNIKSFLKREFQMKRGLYNLINLFYNSSVIRWYLERLKWGINIASKELYNILLNEEQMTPKTASSGLNSLINMFENMPTYEKMGLGIVEKIGKEKICEESRRY